MSRGDGERRRVAIAWCWSAWGTHGNNQPAGIQK